MIKAHDAIRIIADNIKELSSENINIDDSFGRILSVDITANSNIPPFDNSAMDGYAVISGDIKKPQVLLTNIEDVPAGYVAKKILTKGKAIRIMTGAPLPKGADSVVMAEDTEIIGDFVKVLKTVKPGENIRKSGEDIKKGEVVIRKGTVLKPAHLGLLASLGVSSVKAGRRPEVSILSTGDEITGVGEKLRPGKIRNSNGYSLYAQVISAGGIPHNIGIARDRKKEIRDKILAGLKSDLLIISGGVSVGDYDLVKLVLEELGMNIKFKKIAMKPGKPVVFGLINNKPVFGLPGNPVSSMITFELFVKSAILKLMGNNNDNIKYVEAKLGENINKKKGMRYFLRAMTEWKGGGYRTRTTGPQGSGILRSMAIANSLIELQENAKMVKKGDRVRVRFL